MFSKSSQWIGMPDALRGRSAPLFRREFFIERNVASARLVICGLGCFEASLNGRRVGDHLLDPAQTDYEERVFSVIHDISSHLRIGQNVIGVMVGDGWFNQDLVWTKDFSYGSPRLIATIEITYMDGTRLTIPTDKHWLCARGPVVSNNLYSGELYDARMEQPGWDEAEFDIGKWKHFSRWVVAEPVAAPPGKMEEQKIPPIKAIETLTPQSITQPQPGYYVVDMGQNFSGWVRIRLRATAGSCIRLRYAEALATDGMVDTASTGFFATGVEQVDSYTCKGGEEELWEPRFTYHGFRYVEVVGWPGEIEAEAITGVVVHTALEQAGFFECSDDRLNQLHHIALWTHRSNIHGFPEDCPVRERCGWLGDAHIICDYSFFNYAGDLFWEKYIGDIESARLLNNGLPPMIAPGRRTGGTASPDWMAAMLIVPWTHYVFYGRRTVLERIWDGMCAVLKHFETLAKDGLLYEGLGDWFDPGESARPSNTPPVKTSTLIFGQCAQILSKVSTILGHRQEALHYAGLAAQIRSAFRSAFYDCNRHDFGSQTANAMALALGYCEPEETRLVAATLANDVRQLHKDHLSVGIMGMKYLFESLTRHGHGATALALMHQDTYPGFGDLIAKGATTLWEYWGEPEVDALHGARSLNHPMMGGYDSWFYNTLAGIRPSADHPGFRRFFLEPHPLPGLDWVKVTYDCPHGRITSEWRNENATFSWDIVVPEETVALARLPGTATSFELFPGTYNFSHPMPAN